LIALSAARVGQRFERHDLRDDDQPPDKKFVVLGDVTNGDPPAHGEMVAIRRCLLERGSAALRGLIGTGVSQEQAIIGETPNLAPRLQGIAEPNMVVIAEGTRKLLGDLFELEDLGPSDLKGTGSTL
jgi:hypothetical protein